MLNNLLQDSFIITGANGWLGRALINKLYEIYGKEIENKVIAFSNSTSSINIDDNFNLKTFNYSDDIKFSGQYIFCHFAFLTMDKVTLMDEKEYIEQNLIIRNNAQKIILKSKPKSIFLSSSGDVYKKNNLYGRLKLEDEQFFSDLAESLSSNIIIPRIFNIGGPYINKHNLYALSDFISQLMQTKEIVIKARKPVIRSYVHIEDIFNICFSWVNDENNVSKKLIFDSRNHKDVSLLELAQLIMNVVDINGNIISDIKSEDADIYIGNGVLQNKICQQYGIELSSYDKIILDTYYFLSNAKYNT